MPKISVCSSTFNHEKYVTEAINSVLNQTCQDFELIMTDDASTDDNVEKIRAFNDPRITLHVHEQNRGNMVAARTCYEHTKGDYIAFLTTDDVWEPDMLRILSNYLDEHPEALAVFGQPIFIDEEGNDLNHPHSLTCGGVGKSRHEHLQDLFWITNNFCCPTAMIRRSTFERFGFFAPYLRQIHDMAYWIRLVFAGEVAILPDRVLRFRIRRNEANAGSLTPANWRRIDFEVFQNLQTFVKEIQDITTLTAIFPEVKTSPYPLENRLLKFHLAHVALSRDSALHRLFGLQLLYELMSDAETAEYLRATCNFDYPDMFRIQGEKPIFSYDRELERPEQANAATEKTLATV